MFQYAKMFDAEIRKTGAKTVFYETWGRKNRPEMYGVVEQAYIGLATKSRPSSPPPAPPGTMALKSNPTLALHIADLSHPTPAGTYLNACVFYETFFGKSPEGLPRHHQERRRQGASSTSPNPKPSCSSAPPRKPARAPSPNPPSSPTNLPPTDTNSEARSLQ